MRVPGVRFVAGRNDYADRDGRKYGIAIHNTSNTASAAAEASYAQRRTDGVSAHFYVDDQEVVQSIDTRYRTGHAGSSEGNDNAVSVEITGTNGRSRAWWLGNVAWDQLGRALAHVCREYGIEPRRATVAEMKRNPRVRAFYSHDDMRRAWQGTTHTDPGPNFPWDTLFAAVKRHLTPPPPARPPVATPQPEVDDMQLTDKIGGTDNPNRTVGDVLRDLANLRNELVTAIGQYDGPGRAAAGALLLAPAQLVDQVAALAATVDRIAARVDELAAGGNGAG